MQTERSSYAYRYRTDLARLLLRQLRVRGREVRGYGADDRACIIIVSLSSKGSVYEPMTAKEFHSDTIHRMAAFFLLGQELHIQISFSNVFCLVKLCTAGHILASMRLCGSSGIVGLEGWLWMMWLSWWATLAFLKLSASVTVTVWLLSGLGHVR